ncbi:MAG TPA: alpha-E domain-containing protein [Acidimicrobiales bacterium]|nr:alpha-E domain-containing protein [Acidimicrobiales bacterium]
MLSRIAESLYWVGRYVERAEDTARILDVHVHHILEDPTLGEETACRVLLGVMGTSAPAGSVNAQKVVELLGFDESDTCSIIGALGAARENARGVREVLSTEMWECLNASWLALPAQRRQAGDMGPHVFFQYVKERAAMMAGLTDSTMARDDGWRFLVLGRSLERVDMTARLLLAGFCDPSESPDWVTTLRSCSAHEAFLRTYRRGVDSSLVAEFLLLDRLFPRSAFHALGLAESCLAELVPSAGRAGQEHEARRILGRARNELEFAGVRELLADVPAHLRALQSACAEAGAAVARRFFQQSAPVEWQQERVGPL